MPYIPTKDRDQLDAGARPETPGELTYVLCRIAIEYVRRRGVRFITMCEALGALQAASLEFYRRAVAPYEDAKAAEAGDLEWPK